MPAEAAVTTGLIEIIRAASGAMTSAEQRVGKQILADPPAVLRSSVTQLAKAAGVSPATAVRFCQTVGLRGYQELKLRLAAEVLGADQSLTDRVDAGADARDVTARVLQGASDALAEAAANVDGAELARIAEAARAASSILLVAVGTSAPLAADAAYRLTMAGLRANYLPDAHAQHVAAAQLDANCLCLAISHTGSTVETLAATRAARAAGAATAAITSFSASPLTDLVDVVVVGGSRETAHRIEALSSRLVHLSILDALFSLVVAARPDAGRALAATADVIVEHRI
ncbi:MAG: MurR/RpiR family transcriptional regulator [Bifidobacteriaceae bacterium]|nr:MurR/RpiR family transcriptional regulator [Bifidobacteriaceae bacterium]